MKKVCIFDFDGTLVDTFTDAGIYYNKALEMYGFPKHELENYKYLMGRKFRRCCYKNFTRKCKKYRKYR